MWPSTDFFPQSFPQCELTSVLSFRIPPPTPLNPSLNCQLWLRIPSLALDFLPLIKCSLTVLAWPQFRSPCSLDLPVDCVSSGSHLQDPPWYHHWFELWISEEGWHLLTSIGVLSVSNMVLGLERFQISIIGNYKKGFRMPFVIWDYALPCAKQLNLYCLYIAQ